MMLISHRLYIRDTGVNWCVFPCRRDKQGSASADGASDGTTADHDTEDCEVFNFNSNWFYSTVQKAYSTIFPLNVYLLQRDKPLIKIPCLG